MTPAIDIRTGDALKLLRAMPADSVHCVVTSPPYYGLRDYGTASVNWPPYHYAPMPSLPLLKVKRQTCSLGLEADPFSFVGHLVLIFEEIRRVLHPQGTAWVNMGDSYAGARGGKQGKNGQCADRTAAAMEIRHRAADRLPRGYKAKDLMGIPWRLASALQAAGWYLRQEIIWDKPNPLPESVKDRCTKSHEQLFLLTKSRRYHFDAAAIAEPVSDAMLQQVRDGYDGESSELFVLAGAQDPSSTKRRIIEGARKKMTAGKWADDQAAEASSRMVENIARARADGGAHDAPFGLTANKRSVWTVTTAQSKDKHFATFPEDLVKPCILAGCPAEGIVLDPFAGSGTTGKVALELGRSAILLELNPAYAEIARRRCHVTPGFAFAKGGVA